MRNIYTYRILFGYSKLEPVELDEMELEKYIEFVVGEVRKGSQR
jgi:hypothetical protein